MIIDFSYMIQKCEEPDTLKQWNVKRLGKGITRIDTN